MGQAAEKVVQLRGSLGKSARDTLLQNAANELVFAVVGHVGSGTTEIANKLMSLLEDPGAIGQSYDASYIKATDLISAWATRTGKAVPALAPGGAKTLGYVTEFQNLGDAMRKDSNDPAAVAKAFAVQIRNARAEKLHVTVAPGEAVKPDGNFRAYVLDSIRHPAEVQLLRHIYQDAFVLIGVVCESDTRHERLRSKYPEAGKDQVEAFMQRDEKAPEAHGQKVSDAFHLADFFIDNTPSRKNAEGGANRAWEIADKLSRLVKIIRQGEDVIRPEAGETAMWHAYGAAMRSACMSRQVGAALLDRYGNLIATGTNEVPRAGGGVYGDGFLPEPVDHRCIYRVADGEQAYCSNTREQNEIISALLKSISEISVLSDAERADISQLFRKGRIGELIEFSRAVHAEMDAILSAAREGKTTVGTRLFVTTFPCHYCARHIVSAGIDEVQYIEPYPKSRALKLHNDSVQIVAENWVLPSSERSVAAPVLPDSGRKPAAHAPRVLFRPFSGVAPRLYRRAFLKEGDLKNALTGDKQVSPPEWGSPYHLRKLGYAELEAELSKDAE
jgi:deoxycytidylate deaminase